MNGNPSPWHVESIDRELVERLEALHTPYPKGVASGVEIVGDRLRETEEG